NGYERFIHAVFSFVAARGRIESGSNASGLPGSCECIYFETCRAGRNPRTRRVGEMAFSTALASARVIDPVHRAEGYAINRHEDPIAISLRIASCWPAALDGSGKYETSIPTPMIRADAVASRPASGSSDFAVNRSNVRVSANSMNTMPANSANAMPARTP